jgi:DNA mismatch endonuclease, patch repair protein
LLYGALFRQRLAMDKISKERRSKNMQAIKSKNTKPELVIRKIIHGMGYRYRLHKKDFPGKPDLVFSVRKKVIFINGCFWHQHDDPNCKISRVPKSNHDFWLPKLKRTKERDLSNLKTMCQMGWKSLTIWECELKDMPMLKEKVRIFLQG